MGIITLAPQRRFYIYIYLHIYVYSDLKYTTQGCQQKMTKKSELSRVFFFVRCRRQHGGEVWRGGSPPSIGGRGLPQENFEFRDA